MSIQDLTNKTESEAEKGWIYAFRIIGIIMFLAGIWKSLVTMFWFGKEILVMTSFQMYFATIGFVFALAGKQLGIFANNIGAALVNKFFK